HSVLNPTRIVFVDSGPPALRRGGLFLYLSHADPAEANRGPGRSGCAAAVQASQTLIISCIKNKIFIFG
ncbi:hypothetical protein, partial [Delftia sp. SD018]|uniref:hypothetical protein n=1 Tax=Delftia sp. SD018 TaxID=2781389 RepID=UPI001A96118D